MLDLSEMPLDALLRLRGNASAQLAVTSPHLTPLLYDALTKRRAACEEELAKRSPAPASRVALRGGYDEDSPLEDELQDLDPGQRYGY